MGLELNDIIGVLLCYTKTRTMLRRPLVLAWAAWDQVSRPCNGTIILNKPCIDHLYGKRIDILPDIYGDSTGPSLWVQSLSCRENWKIWLYDYLRPLLLPSILKLLYFEKCPSWPFRKKYFDLSRVFLSSPKCWPDLTTKSKHWEEMVKDRPSCCLEIDASHWTTLADGILIQVETKGTDL